MNRLVRVLCACTLVAASAGSVMTGPAAASNAAPDEILVLTLNLEEAYTQYRGDLADNFEVDNFARRVKKVVPQAPDVVLLQEVNHQTSALAARRLSRRVGQKYMVAVRPIQNTTIEYPGKHVQTETAILLNKETMAVVDRGGYITTTYPRSAAGPGDDISVKRHAFMLARQRATGVKVPLVSVHYAMVKLFRSERLSNRYRGKWSHQIENKLAKKYAADDRRRVAVAGGDFNASRCVSGSFADCREAAWWKVFSTTPHKYVDTLFSLGLPAGVDVIFSTGSVRGGNWDKAGDFKESDRKNFYSDHRLRWTTVSPKETS